MEIPVLQSCMREVTVGGVTSTANVGREGIVKTYCTSMAQKLVARERELLKTATAYDAAYRSLMQFSGLIDTFVSTLRGTFLTQIRESVSLLGNLGRIPCFLSECNE